MNKTEIFYFSGTGNSLFVAKELQKRISNSKLLPIVNQLENKIIQTDAKIVGIVFLCHALTIPLAVKQFLRKIDLSSTEYIFAIATRFGTVFRGFEIINKLLRKQNKQLNSQFIINMCHNEAPRSQKNYSIPSKTDILEIESVVLQKMDQISHVIINRQISLEKDDNILIKSSENPIIGIFIEKLVVSLISFSEHIGGVNYFYHDDKCNGCGLCAKVCLSGKIRIEDNEPIWEKNKLCYMCYACVNYCPHMSVQVSDIPGVKSYTKENGRYPHPYATVNDIAMQKHSNNINTNENKI